MGTAISCFFPADIERSPDSVQAILERTFSELGDTFLEIASASHFSSRSHGHWWCVLDDTTGEVHGEGPFGFMVWVFPRCINLTQMERFGALIDAKYWKQDARIPLRRALEHVVGSMGIRPEMAVAASGFGDTDAAMDVAGEGGSFEDVCHCLRAELGPPAVTWEELERGEDRWYLKL
jgi:hypothetical protein